MNTETGRIYPTIEKAFAAGTRDGFAMLINPTPEQIRRGKVGRNDPCPCGSGKKFKRCHLGKRADA